MSNQTHYDRKVRKQGFTVVVSLGKVLPHDWKYTRITPLRVSEKTVIVQFDKLLGRGINAGKNKS